VLVVVDTNVLISGIFWGGSPNKLLEKWANDDFSIISSSPILDEYIRVIKQIGQKRPNLVKNWIDFISINSTVVDVKISIDICRDHDDNKFLECALSADVDYIVSGDKDLLILKQIEKIPIVTATQFLKVFN